MFLCGGVYFVWRIGVIIPYAPFAAAGCPN